MNFIKIIIAVYVTVLLSSCGEDSDNVRYVYSQNKIDKQKQQEQNTKAKRINIDTITTNSAKSFEDTILEQEAKARKARKTIKNTANKSFEDTILEQEAKARKAKKARGLGSVKLSKGVMQEPIVEKDYSAEPESMMIDTDIRPSKSK